MRNAAGLVNSEAESMLSGSGGSGFAAAAFSKKKEV